MSRDNSAEVYQLFWDDDHLDGEDYDAEVVRFPGWEQVAGWQSTRDIQTPDSIYFLANFDTLARTDYPANNVSWPIMSRRMLETLLSLGDVRRRVVPVVMLDKSLPPRKRLGPAGEPRPGAAHLDYSVVQLLEHGDYFDWDRSEYQPSPYSEGRVSQISRLVFKVPPGGFPPIFRLAAKINYLFVSAPAKRALEEAGIRGVEFWSTDRIRV